MNPELNYPVANEHIADLRRTAERQRFARFAKRESVLARIIAQVWSRERPVGRRAPAQLGDVEPATRATDPAAAEA